LTVVIVSNRKNPEQIKRFSLYIKNTPFVLGCCVCSKLSLFLGGKQPELTADSEHYCNFLLRNAEE